MTYDPDELPIAHGADCPCGHPACEAKRIKVVPKRKELDCPQPRGPKPHPFSTRPGYDPKRCNAICKKSKKLCRRITGGKRCNRHGGRGNGGGWHTGKRKELKGIPYFKTPP